MEEKKKSGVKGVTWNKKGQKWFVAYRGNYFGSFDCIEDAIKKRREIESEEPQRICVVCGKPIPLDRHSNATTCSEACVEEKDRLHRARNKPGDTIEKKRISGECEICGKKTGRGPNARFCLRCFKKRRSTQSMESHKKMKKIKNGEIPDPPRICVVCGREIPLSRNRAAKTCSDECSAAKNGWRTKSAKNHTQTINFMLQQDTAEKIRETARLRGISVSEYVRELIQRGIERIDETK